MVESRDIHFGHLSYIAASLNLSLAYVRRAILMDHNLERSEGGRTEGTGGGAKEEILITRLRFERLRHGTPFSYPAPITDKEPRYTSFKREPKIGFPTREEADEIAHEEFVRSFEKGGAPPEEREKREEAEEREAMEEERKMMVHINDDSL